MIASLKSLFLTLVKLAQRWPWLIALFGFVSGAASYFLIERSESLAQVIAIVMLVSWLWLVMDSWLRAGFLKRFGLHLPPAVMNYATQMVHQESLFFVLPFFIAVTTWNHSQALFTSLLILCAIVSVVDPLYYKQLAARRSLFVFYHALALFAVLMVALPILFLLTTAQSLALALIMASLFSLPSLVHVLQFKRWWRVPLLLLMLSVVASVLWQMRSWIPPAALRLTEITISQHIDRDARTHGESIDAISADLLKQDGLYAWTAIRAPRGLQEKIHHLWIHNGQPVDRITLDIEGGREKGYRAWTQKLNFPKDPLGQWQVRVVTDSGQLIGIKRFTVEANIDEQESLFERFAPPFIQDQTEQPDSLDDQQSLFERFTSSFNQELDEAPDTTQDSENPEVQPSNFVPLHPQPIEDVTESQESTEQPENNDEQENVEAQK